MVRSISLTLCVLFSVINLNAQITVKKLIKEHKQVVESYIKNSSHIDFENFSATANGQMGEIKFPLRLYKKGPLSRYEMDFMGALFYSVSNDTLSWSFNPITKNFEFDKPESSDMGWLSIDAKSDKLLAFLDSGFVGESVANVKLDSLDLLELKIVKDNETKLFYFDDKTFLLRGEKWENYEYYYSGYKDFQGLLLPTIYIDKNQKEGEAIFEITDFGLGLVVDDSLFVMTEAVIEQYNQPKEQKVNLVQQYYDEGQALRSDGKNQEAIEIFSKGLERNPNDVNTLNVRGLAKISMGDYYGAIADISKAIEFDKGQRPIFFNNLGLAKYYLGDYNGAKKDYEKSYSMDSTSALVASNYGLLMFKFKEFDVVEKFYSKAISLDSLSATSHYYRAIARAELGKYEEALIDYNKAIVMGMEYADLFNYKGVTLYNLEEYDEALESFKKATNLDSTNTQFQYNLGQTYENLSDYNRAIEVYDYLISLDSALHGAYSNRALAYFEVSLFTAAMRDIDKAILLSPNSAVYYDYRAYIKEELGDYNGAVDDYTMSLNLEQDSNIYYRRGLAKINLSNKYDACLDFKKSSELNNENVKNALAEHCKLK